MQARVRVTCMHVPLPVAWYRIWKEKETGEKKLFLPIYVCEIASAGQTVSRDQIAKHSSACFVHPSYCTEALYLRTTIRKCHMLYTYSEHLRYNNATIRGKSRIEQETGWLQYSKPDKVRMKVYSSRHPTFVSGSGRTITRVQQPCQVYVSWQGGQMSAWKTDWLAIIVSRVLCSWYDSVDVDGPMANPRSHQRCSLHYHCVPVRMHGYDCSGSIMESRAPAASKLPPWGSHAPFMYLRYAWLYIPNKTPQLTLPRVHRLTALVVNPAV